VSSAINRGGGRVEGCDSGWGRGRGEGAFCEGACGALSIKKSSTWRLQLGGSPCKSLCPKDVVAKSLKKGHTTRVNKNPTLQYCEHCPAVIKAATDCVSAGASRQTPGAALDLRCGNYPAQYRQIHHRMPALTMREADPRSHEHC
jgi:hypothetical protein